MHPHGGVVRQERVRGGACGAWGRNVALRLAGQRRRDANNKLWRALASFPAPGHRSYVGDPSARLHALAGEPSVRTSTVPSRMVATSVSSGTSAPAAVARAVAAAMRSGSMANALPEPPASLLMAATRTTWPRSSHNMAATFKHNMAAKTLRLALVQLAVGADKAANVRRAVELVRRAADARADIVALPVRTSRGGGGVHHSTTRRRSRGGGARSHEHASRARTHAPHQECFNSPYGTKHFPEYAESIPGPTSAALSEAARAAGVYVIGGAAVRFRPTGGLRSQLTSARKAVSADGGPLAPPPAQAPTQSATATSCTTPAPCMTARALSSPSTARSTCLTLTSRERSASRRAKSCRPATT